MTNKTNVLASMTAARDLLAAGWTQRALARDADGKSVEFESEEATCFCSMGAVVRVGGTGGEVYKRVETLTPSSNLIAFNDAPGRTQAEVVAVFDEAIEALKLEIVIDNLTNAKAVLEVPGAWTTGWFYRDAEGYRVNSTGAVCFCAMGAVSKVSGTRAFSVVDITEGKLLKDCIPYHAVLKMNEEGAAVSVANFNDAEGRTLPEVLALFDAAIALAKAGVK